MSKLCRTNLFAALTVVSVTGLGCDDGAVDRIDNRIDCRAICDKYEECVDDDFDVDECKDDCRQNALDDNEFESKVDRCSDCVTGDDSCVETAWSCTDECVGIVP
jgi:hypothetical protein